MGIITTHRELAHAIAGKRILHLNSLGKDAIACSRMAQLFAPSNVEIVSCFFKFEHGYPSDAKYWEYLKRRYPRTRFVTEMSLVEMNEKMVGGFQSPLFHNYVINTQEYDSFSIEKQFEETRLKYGADYICSGMSCYEGMGRALYLRRVGLLDDKRKMIYPIGLMKQAQIFDVLKRSGVRLNPSYKYAPESHDNATYFKMRQAFLARPAFKRMMYKHFPLLVLDEYRWERLMK